MSDAGFHIPFPKNEPVLSYTPGSPERAQQHDHRNSPHNWSMVTFSLLITKLAQKKQKWP